MPIPWQKQKQNRKHNSLLCFLEIIISISTALKYIIKVILWYLWVLIVAGLCVSVESVRQGGEQQGWYGAGVSPVQPAAGVPSAAVLCCLARWRNEGETVTEQPASFSLSLSLWPGNNPNSLAWAAEVESAQSLFNVPSALRWSLYNGLRPASTASGFQDT